MKKLLLLSILLLSIYSCKKDDDITEPIIEVPILVNPVNGVIEIIEGIDINSVIIQNGSVKKSILEEDFEIDALTDISSAQDNQGNIIYLHSKYLSPSTAQNKSAKNKNSSASIKLTPEETARALLFNSLGLHYISNDSKFYENIGKIIELDGTLAPLFNQLVTAIENDIETNGYLTNLTYQSNILTTYNDAFRTALDISSTILNWPSEIFDLIEPDEQEYDVANAPYFLINVNGTPKRSNKIASFHGGCVIEIKSANKLTDGSWDLKLDYYNKFPGVKYVTEMYFDNNGNRVYSKESLKNIIKPYNSSELYSDLTSLSTVKDIFIDFADIAANGILASDWHTTQATKNEIELNISNLNNHLLVGNVWENNDLLFYSMVEIVGKTMGLMSTIDKIGSKKGDDDSKKDLLKKFVNHLKDPSNRVGEKILKNILLIKDKSGNLNALNTHIKELAIDLSTEFLEWISSEVGKAALQIYIDKEKTTLVGNVELNQLKFVEEVFSVVKNKDITLNNAINVLSDKFPFFKAVNTGLKIGTVAQDIAIFFFNMKTPVLHRQIYLPFESEILPENGSTIDIGTEFSIDFSTEITLTTDNSKKIKIIEHNSNNVIQEISFNQLSIDNTNQKLIFSPTGLNLNTQYYITIPERLVFNNTGETFQGIFTNDIWSFTTSDTSTVTSVTPQTATLNTGTTFTITGVNLTEGMEFWIADLSNITEVSGGNSSERYFKGTPINSTGIKEGVVKNVPGGNTLFTFQVTIENPVQNIYNGDVTLTTQQEVDDFGANNYTEIIGNLTIQEVNSDMITNIKALSALKTIEGSFFYYDISGITSLTGLENLKDVKHSFFIGRQSLVNNSLTSLNGLKSLETVGNGLFISAMNAITTLTGLESLISVGHSLEIKYNNNLVSLNGLGALKSVGLALPTFTNLDIAYNNNLSSLDGLDNLTTLNGSLTITNNQSLNSLQSLKNLSTVGNKLTISVNNTLSNLDGLENIISLKNNLIIGGNNGRGNINLTNLCGIKQLITNGQVGSSEYSVIGNAYNPTFQEIQNTGNGGCEQ
jgi:hypothetical protein